MPRAIAVSRPVSRQSEDSIPLRVVVLAITVLSVGAVAAVGATDPATAVASVLLIPAGSWLSYRRRRATNTGLKVALAAGLLAALLGFLLRVQHAQSVDQARVTLGSLFVWVQVLHSFDVPRRRDLAFSVVASVALMAEAGSLSLDARFGFLLVPYVALVAAWLYLSDRARGREEAGPFRLSRVARPERVNTIVAPARTVAAWLTVAAMVTTAVFLATPRLPGTKVIAPPFALARRVQVPGFSGAVVNPDLPSQAGGGGAGLRGAGYPGFGTQVNLDARGRLSDRLVMHVRAPQAALWRGQAYDRFDGTTWTAPNQSVDDLGRGAGQAIDVPPRQSTGTPTRTVVQTFFIVSRQPNIVFAAFRPREVYFPSGRLALDRFDSLRSPILLEPDTIYSVVSDVPVATPSELRASPPAWSERVLGEYTRLPADIPARVVRLAHLITDGQATTYDKVIAVQRWLQVHTRYTVDIPPDPPGVDAVDYFLFERREGYCEHIASAMAILLRAVGIPTRFVVGFGPGEHNLFTGYYDVLESDAHSWVEVDYTGVGWVEYDPTFGVPDAAPGLGTRFIATQMFAAVARFLSHALPGPARAAARAVGRAIDAAARSWPVVAGVVLSAAGLLIAARRRRKRRRDPPLAGVAAAFASLCDTFARRGRARPAHRTPSEHLETLLSEDALAREASIDVERIIRAFERERFAARPPEEEEVTESLAAAARIRERVR
jgi:protein-glutamine gamma-glutamyltransferase